MLVHYTGLVKLFVAFFFLHVAFSPHNLLKIEFKHQKSFSKIRDFLFCL